MGNYDTGRKTDFKCFIQDAELLNPIPTRPCDMIYCHSDKNLPSWKRNHDLRL